jgi:hypothetical protein
MGYMMRMSWGWRWTRCVKNLGRRFDYIMTNWKGFFFQRLNFECKKTIEIYGQIKVIIEEIVSSMNIWRHGWTFSSSN